MNLLEKLTHTIDHRAPDLLATREDEITALRRELAKVRVLLRLSGVSRACERASAP